MSRWRSDSGTVPDRARNAEDGVSIWGKIIGGTLGFAVGGPLGALVGAVAGHMVDRSKRDARGDATLLGRGDVDLQAAFTVAFIALAAKLAKADGQVTRDEVATLKRVFDVPAHAADDVGAIFNEAKRDAGGFEPYAEQIAALLGHDRSVLEGLVGALLMIAHADGVYHPAERAYIGEVARIFGFGPADVRRIERTFVVDGSPADSDPYEILGVGADAEDAEVRTAYRRLLGENHPDKLMAQGLPEEFIEVANRKMAEINAAYDRIKKERNLT